ncbi:MAG TPA: ABC transporter permease, partial [Solirubrobacteraceae bacterium]
LTAVGSIVGHESVVRKTQFPRLVIPLSVVLTSLFNLGLNLVVVLIFTLGFGIAPTWSWLLLIPVLLALFVFTTAVSMLLSALYPRFRDVLIIWTVFSTALFYATPVLYPLSAVSSTLRDVISLNPLSPLLGLVQRWITNPQTPWPTASSQGGPVRMAVAIAIYVVVCVLAVWIFRREAPRIAEEL